MVGIDQIRTVGLRLTLQQRLGSQQPQVGIDQIRTVGLRLTSFLQNGVEEEHAGWELTGSGRWDCDS